MADRLAAMAAHPLGMRLLAAVGLPQPPELVRATGGWRADELGGKVAAIGGDGHAAAAARAAIVAAGGVIADDAQASGQATRAVDILILDATGMTTPADLRDAYAFFHPRLPLLARGGRIVILAPIPGADAPPETQAIAQALEGFCRSLGKEVGRRGAVSNLLRVESGATDRLDLPLRFFAGPRSVYVGGQAVSVSAAAVPSSAWPRANGLAGKVALVTGAARGIGAASAARLAADGAHVLCLDVPQAAAPLAETARAIGAAALTIDLTAPDAVATLLAGIGAHGGRLDVVVHNAGITRDRTLARMSAAEWDSVVAVNLSAILAVDAALLAQGTIADNARLVYLSSVGGVAGNPGQTNYAATKAALIGYVRALAPTLASRGITANAVAPGFIETAMTDRMPFLPREVGRRLNALSQGGRAEDVAELVAFLAAPGAFGITGQTIRVCGQALIGA